jgi:GAF domain-containing protein
MRRTHGVDYPVDHWTEAERLEILQSYGILDTPPEPEFDGLARIAAIACGTMVALVNFVTEDRQWFKAELGLGRREIPIDSAFCSYTLQQPDLFVVPDTHKDVRFSRNVLVTEHPYLRFYAGALVRSGDGIPLGTVCVLDAKPRDGLTFEQGEVLILLARQVTALLECRRKLQRFGPQDSRATSERPQGQ